MSKLAQLRKEAKGMGISAAVLRSATTSAALEKAIADHKAHDKPRKKSAVAKKKHERTASAPKRKPTTRKNSGRKASTPAKSKTAKRSSNSNGSEAGGRNLLSKVSYTKTDGWNARDGSAPDRIIKALKKFKGDRTKVFDFLKGDVWDFVGKKTANGEKRDKKAALKMLKYRIARTEWEFAMRTGQHEAAANRVKYGTGGTGNGTFKPKKATQKASKATSAKPKAKPGRKPATAKKPTGARRGRPPGSKNKPKAGSRK